MKLPSWLFVLLRAGIGALFIYSGYSKLMEPAATFATAIAGYQIVGVRAATFMASTMPWAEMIAGAFFMTGLWFTFSIVVLWVFNLMFIGAISSALWRRLPIQNCGCFGDAAHAIPIQATLALDAFLFLLLLGLYINKDKTSQLGLDGFLKKR